MPSKTASPASARCAGLLYLIIILCGLTAELALRGPLIAGGAEMIRANLGQFRLSLLADLVMLIADIALALAFFTLLKHVNPALARVAMVFRLGQAAMIGASLVLLSGVPALITSGQDQLALTLATLHANGYDAGLVLFGVNCLLMANLLCHGGAPKVLPPLMALSGLVYIAGGVTKLAFPDLNALMQPAYAICILSETALCLWLLIAGRIAWQANQTAPVRA